MPTETSKLLLDAACEWERRAPDRVYTWPVAPDPRRLDADPTLTRCIDCTE